MQQQYILKFLKTDCVLQNLNLPTNSNRYEFENFQLVPLPVRWNTGYGERFTQEPYFVCGGWVRELNSHSPLRTVVWFGSNNKACKYMEP